MKDIVVIGAGKIGACVAGLLAQTGDYQVTLVDRSPEVLGNLDRVIIDAQRVSCTKSHLSRDRLAHRSGRLQGIGLHAEQAHFELA